MLPAVPAGSYFYIHLSIGIFSVSTDVEMVRFAHHFPVIYEKEIILTFSIKLTELIFTPNNSTDTKHMLRFARIKNVLFKNVKLTTIFFSNIKGDNSTDTKHMLRFARIKNVLFKNVKLTLIFFSNIKGDLSSFFFQSYQKLFHHFFSELSTVFQQFKQKLKK